MENIIATQTNTAHAPAFKISIEVKTLRGNRGKTTINIVATGVDSDERKYSIKLQKAENGTCWLTNTFGYTNNGTFGSLLQDCCHFLRSDESIVTMNSSEFIVALWNAAVEKWNDTPGISEIRCPLISISRNEIVWGEKPATRRR